MKHDSSNNNHSRIVEYVVLFDRGYACGHYPQSGKTTFYVCAGLKCKCKVGQNAFRNKFGMGAANSA